MDKYNKINSLFKRDMKNKGRFIPDAWSTPELEYLANHQWEFTEKVDGTNIRIHKNLEGVVFGGRTENAQIPAHLFNTLNETFTLEKLSVVELDEFTLYGEGYGHKIQSGGDFFPNEKGKADFILFDVKINGNWQPRESVERFAEQLSIPIVPIMGTGTLYDAIKLCTDGFNSQLKDSEPEGIVARPLVELQSRTGDRIITKVKIRDFRI